MGESNIRMIHLLLPLSVTNGQQSISLKNTQHYEREFNFDHDRALLEDYGSWASIFWPEENTIIIKVGM